MPSDPESSEDRLVSAAEVARLAGVTRAAVSNWRRRYADFPAPVGGERNALFAWSEVDAWLGRNRKSGDTSSELLLWQALRSRYPEDLTRGVAHVAEFLAVGSSKSLNPEIQSLIRKLTTGVAPTEVVQGLVDRLANSEQVSAGRLVRAVRHFAGPASGVVFDPACGIGSLLLGMAGDSTTMLAGQEISSSAVRLAAARVRLSGAVDVKIRSGDSLRTDRWPDLRADCVVCDPPVKTTDWGREALLIDPRWEFGVPTRAEGELAWLQHCYAHVAPGGTAIVVMPPSAAYRPAGRRIRAEIVRRGVLAQLVALPGGMAATHGQPLHLWVLERPVTPEAPATSVRMVDVSANDPDGPLEPAPDQLASVPLIDLLDDTVDLTPSQHVSKARTDRLSEYLTVRGELVEQLRQLLEVLPSFGAGPGSLDGAMLKTSELARAGLVEFTDQGAVSKSAQLDGDYLRGFLRSTTHPGRVTAASSAARGSRVPQLSIDDQRRYGAAFRALDEFEQRATELARLSVRAAGLARDGLVSGSLRPPAE